MLLARATPHVKGANRITEVRRYSDSALIAQYAYDALGRRINKQVFNSGGLDTTGSGRFFYYDGHRLIDQYADNGTGQVHERSYLWGLQYIDELVGQGSGGTMRFVFTDANYNVVGLTSGSGNTIQQYAWHPYGKRLAVEDGQGQTVDIASNPTLLTTPIGHQAFITMRRRDSSTTGRGSTTRGWGGSCRGIHTKLRWYLSQS